MLSSVVRLGPFVLGAPIPAHQGGTGEIWQGMHPPSGAAVAIKLLRRTADPRLDQLLRNEVQHAARLDHPAIVRILDMGTVDAEAEAASIGRLRRGRRWVAMEYAGGGSLAGRIRDHRFSWEELRDILLRLLGALAHAHARGVVHRDLKPDNVVLGVRGDPNPGWKLTDFGVAFGGDDEADAFAVGMGSPGYAAPEQIRGDAPAQGPWTDLYALGAVAWELARGYRPYVAEDPVELARLHLEAPVPSGAGRGPGFEAWVQRLLQKDPGARFRSAAEATAALLAVTDASPAPPPSVRSDPFATLPLLRPAPIAPVELTIPTLARLPVHTPLPAGAGLGLHGLREVPPFGRAAELDQLWGLLRAVTEARRPEVCEVAGPEGLGKSALADGFATRAAEVGVRVVRFPMEGGPAALVREELRCAGASGDELGALALVRLGFEGIHDAADRALIRRSLSDGDPAGAARLLVGLARGRPVVLVVDGPAAAAWSLAQRVLDGEPAPVLIVVTTAGEQATPLSPAPRRIALGRLPDDDIATLVRSLLPLDRRAVDRIVRAAEGRPTVAVELLDRLVHAGLRAGPDGLGPADPDAAIDGRDPAVSLEPDVRDRLEVAAALGASVRDAEWAAACAIRGCPLADADLLEPFVRARLIEPTPGGLRFRRPQFREALLAGARARGVEAAIHRACAAALADPSPDRLGLHLAASGDVENSRLPLVRGAEMRLVRSDYLGAEELLDHLVFPTPGDDASERLRAEADLLRVRALFGRGLHDAAGKLARDVAARVRGKGWNNLLGRALRYRGMAAFRGGRDAQLAEAFHVWALDALGGTDPEEEARCLLHRAEAMVRQRAGEEARPVLDAAAAAFERLGDLQGVADCEIARCEAALLVQGGAAEAARNARSALDRFAEIGNLYGVARCYNALGDLARRAQAFGDAAEAYRNATTACERIGAPDRLTVEANLALVLEEQGRFDEAERRLQGALHGRQAPAVSLLVYLHAALLPCLAARADRAAFADTLPRVADEIAALRRVDRDLAIPLTLATNLLSGREGWRTERNAVRTLAMAQWRQLGGREAQEALTALEGEGDET